MAAKSKADTSLVRIIVDPRDAGKDQFIPHWALQHYVVGGLIKWDLTNMCWCSSDGEGLPYKEK